MSFSDTGDGLVGVWSIEVCMAAKANCSCSIHKVPDCLYAEEIIHVLFKQDWFIYSLFNWFNFKYYPAELGLQLIISSASAVVDPAAEILVNSSLLPGVELWVYCGSEWTHCPVYLDLVLALRLLILPLPLLIYNLLSLNFRKDRTIYQPLMSQSQSITRHLRGLLLHNLMNIQPAIIYRKEHLTTSSIARYICSIQSRFGFTDLYVLILLSVPFIEIVIQWINVYPMTNRALIHCY